MSTRPSLPPSPKNQPKSAEMLLSIDDKFFERVSGGMVRGSESSAPSQLHQKLTGRASQKCRDSNYHCSFPVTLFPTCFAVLRRHFVKCSCEALARGDIRLASLKDRGLLPGCSRILWTAALAEARM
jgi:hypothetical protein